MWLNDNGQQWAIMGGIDGDTHPNTHRCNAAIKSHNKEKQRVSSKSRYIYKYRMCDDDPAAKITTESNDGRRAYETVHGGAR